MKKLYLVLLVVIATPRINCADDWSASLTWQNAFITYFAINLAALSYGLMTDFAFLDPNRDRPPTKDYWLRSIEEDKKTADYLEPKIYILKNICSLPREKERELFEYLEKELAAIEETYTEAKKNPTYKTSNRLHERILRLNRFIDSEFKVINQIETLQNLYLAAQIISQQEIENLEKTPPSNNPFIRELMTLKRMYEEMEYDVENPHLFLNQKIEDAIRLNLSTQKYYATPQERQLPHSKPKNFTAATRAMYRMHGVKAPSLSQKKIAQLPPSSAPAE